MRGDELGQNQHLTTDQVLKTLRALGYCRENVISTVDIDGFVGAEICSANTLRQAVNAVMAGDEDKNNKLILFKVGAESREFVDAQNLNNHYVALHFCQDVNDALKLTYIDPAGAGISQQISEILSTHPLLEGCTIESSEAVLQFTNPTAEGVVPYQMRGNDRDCGVLVALAADMVRRNYQGRNAIRLNNESSNALGGVLRRLTNREKTLGEVEGDIGRILQSGIPVKSRSSSGESEKILADITTGFEGFGLADKEKNKTPSRSGRKSTYIDAWHSPVGEVMLKSELNKLAITPEKYRERTFVKGSATGENKGKIKLENRDRRDKKHRNVAIKYPVIAQSSSEKYKIHESKRGSGNDELFQTAKLRKWKKLDKDFGLSGDDVTFNDAFNLARVKTKELHTFNTGHVGSVFTSADGKGRVTAGYFTASGPKGSKKGWDADKNRVIDAVTAQAQTSKKEEEKELSPIKATREVLKLAVEKVVGYRQNSEENKGKFQSFTSAGLNLSDEVERESVLKTSQAARDKWKMSVVALEKRWNGEDSDGGNYSDKELRSVVKRKVERTKIDSSIHGGEDRSFSPIRTGTPYSNLNFEYNFEQLESASKAEGKINYQAIATVFAQPTPAIRPTPEFKEQITKALAQSRSGAKSAPDKQSSQVNELKKVEEDQASRKLLPEFNSVAVSSSEANVTADTTISPIQASSEQPSGSPSPAAISAVQSPSKQLDSENRG